MRTIRILRMCLIIPGIVLVAIGAIGQFMTPVHASNLFMAHWHLLLSKFGLITCAGCILLAIGIYALGDL